MSDSMLGDAVAREERPGESVARRPAPEGLRWASGGGHPIGGCNGYHLATTVKGTLCGKFGPATPPDPRANYPICGRCAQIAKVPRVLDVA